MSQYQMDFNASTRLATDLNLLPKRFEQEATTAMSQNTDLLHQLVTTAPPQEHKTLASVYGTPFKSERQRRWFFANLRAGNISVPFARTNALIESWQKLVQVAQGVIEGSVFTQNPVARYVQDQAHQSLMLSHWQAAQKLAADAKPELLFNFREAITRTIQWMKQGGT